MENIEWLEKVRKADGDVDEAIKEAKCVASRIWASYTDESD